MLKKVGFYLENQKTPDVDLSRPSEGNPGCGGTEFLFAALPYYLTVLGKGYKPILLANHVDRLPDNVTHVQVADVMDAVRRAKEIGCEIFVYRPRRHAEQELLALIDAMKLPTIAWAHITPLGDHLRTMVRTRYLKALVCVEHEQHDLARDTAIWSKLTYIVNGFDVDSFRLPTPPPKEPGLVVYLGALVPQKGFHLLAKAWPLILQRCPQARLAVIGTGALYDNSAELGPWGIAERNYEERYIVPCLAGIDGRPHQSVTFLGCLGVEKKEILYRAIVGVPNPSGQTENCPGSALEFQACSTPVVSGAYYGMLDTVQGGKTGYLGRNESDLVTQICSLLDNPALAHKLGKNAVQFVQERYNYSSVVSEWTGLLQRLSNGLPPKPRPIKHNLHRHSKLLIWINSYLQKTIGKYIGWPSVIDVKVILFRHYTYIRNKFDN